MMPSMNGVISRAAAMVELLASRGALSPAVIADELGVARSSVYRLVDGTTAVGLTTILPDSRVQLTVRLLHLADAVTHGMSEWHAAQEILDQLAEATDQTAYLYVPRVHEAVCIMWAQGRGIDVLPQKPGRSMPLHMGGASRSILANSPPVVVEGVLAAAPFAAVTPNTITSAAELRTDIERSLREGFTVSDEDVLFGVGAIAVPIFVQGELIASVSVGGPAEDIYEHRTKLLAGLRVAAHALVIGYG